jgi:hypothetical protein
MPNTLFLALITLVACGGGGGGASGASSVSSSSSSASSSVSSVSAPAAPTGVTAVAGNTTVDLNWTASSGATSYHVKRGSAAGGPYTQLSAPITTSYSDTGLTNGNTYYYVVTALNAGGESGNSSEVSAQPAASVPNVVVTVDTTTTKPISPYIYGINFYSPGDPAQLTLSRMGGNRWTAYNWENNASNAGNDYIYSSDSFLGGGTTPAESVRSDIAANQAAGRASLFTVQLQGYVSADKNGAVDMTLPLATRLATRFKPVVNKKGAAFTLTPDASDASVYMDEFVWALDQKLSSSQMFAANAALPSFISLDNEPELWQSTHKEIQGETMVTSDNYIAKTIDLCKAIKDQFPNATIFGPAHYGFAGIYSWQGELKGTLAPTPGGSDWFTDKYLLAMKNAATAYGRRLLDVYDFHWYPEVYDANGVRIVGMDSGTLTDTQVQLIVQSPRDLWDPTFHDPNNSSPWIYQTLGSTPINIIGRLQAKIAASYPGTKLALTEYQNGGGGHIAGTIAQADDLGIFGAQGVFAATY